MPRSVVAFNAHQGTDKGFGPAAGPLATQALADALTARHFRVQRASSPWIVREEHAQLRRELDSGFASAAGEAGVDRMVLSDWMTHRLGGADRVTVVGHEDLLAIPA